MQYYKQIVNDYIDGIGTGAGGEEITQKEYEHILSVIRNRPIPEAGYDYILRTDLTWEQVEAPTASEEEEISDAEALDIILGVSE